MAESYRRAPAGARYAPHAFGGSPVDSRLRIASVDSIARWRLEETQGDGRKAALRDPYNISHSQHLSPSRRTAADFSFDRPTQQLPQSPTIYRTQTGTRRRAMVYMDVPKVHRSSSPFRSPSSSSSSTAMAGPTPYESRYASSSAPRIHLPTVFGDLYESPSVITGVSQQELLRRAARDDHRRRRQRHKINRTNQLQPLVSIPSHLSKGLELNAKNYYGHMDSMGVQESELSLYKPRLDDIYPSTTESTRSPDSPQLPMPYTTGARRTNNYSYGMPSLYSTLPAQQAIVNEADGDGILFWQPSNDQDMQSIDSFPILSKHCGFSVSGPESSSPRYNPTRADNLKSMRNSTCPASNGTGPNACILGVASSPPRRAVRFSHRSLREEWKVDAANTMRDTGTVWNQREPVVVTPTRTSPKSILRRTRFSPVNPAPGTSAAYYAQLQAFREKYHRQKQRERDLVKRIEDASTDNSASPPRDGIFLMYPDGDGEVSPIPTHQNFGGSRNNAYDDAARPNFLVTSSYAKVLVAEYRNPSPVLPFGDDATQEAPTYDDESKDSNRTPIHEWYIPLEETDAGRDGDAGGSDEVRSVSTTSFTQTVAAIVIQAVFRRYRVQWIYSDVLARRRLQRRRLERYRDLYKDSVQMEAPPKNTDELVLHQSNKGATGRPEDSQSVRSSKDSEKIAATKIQAAFRGFWVRDCLSVDSYCATLIQKAWRGHRSHNAFIFSVYSIILIQSLYRRYRARKHLSLVSCSALVIQKTFRGYIARKEIRGVERQEINRLTTGSNLKGKPAEKTLHRRAMFAKRWRQKREDLHRKEAQTKAAIMIQKHWRRFHQEEKYTKVIMDILKIQTFMRRWIAYSHTSNTHSVQAASSFSDASSHSSAADGNSHAGEDSHGQEACPCTRSVIELWQQRLMRSGDSYS